MTRTKPIDSWQPTVHHKKFQDTFGPKEATLKSAKYHQMSMLLLFVASFSNFWEINFLISIIGILSYVCTYTSKKQLLTMTRHIKCIGLKKSSPNAGKSCTYMHVSVRPNSIWYAKCREQNSIIIILLIVKHFWHWILSGKTLINVFH